MKHVLNALLLTAIAGLTSPRAEAMGIFSGMKEKVSSLKASVASLGAKPKSCAALFVSEGATEGATLGEAKASEGRTTMERLREIADLRSSIERGVETAGEIRSQVAELTCRAAECSGAYTWTVAKEIPGAAWNIVRFSGDSDSIRTRVVVPLTGLLRDVRMHRESGDNVQLSRALARLTVFGIAAPLMINRALPQQVVTLSPTMLAAGAAVPVLSVEKGPLLAEVGSMLRSAVVQSVMEAIKTPGISLQDRLGKIDIVRIALEDRILPVIVERLGWTDLNAEIQNWRSVETPDAAPDAESGS